MLSLSSWPVDGPGYHPATVGVLVIPAWNILMICSMVCGIKMMT